jgi:hypothetical protein
MVAEPSVVASFESAAAVLETPDVPDQSSLEPNSGSEKQPATSRPPSASATRAVVLPLV